MVELNDRDVEELDKIIIRLSSIKKTSIESPSICKLNEKIKARSKTLPANLRMAVDLRYTAPVDEVLDTVCPIAERLNTSVQSSARYKDNIAEIDADDARNLLFGLQPKKFNYKVAPNHLMYGLIAEEVEKVLPGAVVKNKQGQADSLRYDNVVALLLSVIQEIDKELTDQTKTIIEMHENMNKLKDATEHNILSVISAFDAYDKYLRQKMDCARHKK